MTGERRKRRSGVPTIADVAQLAGVSQMTVSRVINAEGNVRAETRDTVNAAIRQLDYSPNPAARRLAGEAEQLDQSVGAFTIDHEPAPAAAPEPPVRVLKPTKRKVGALPKASARPRLVANGDWDTF